MKGSTGRDPSAAPFRETSKQGVTHMKRFIQHKNYLIGVAFGLAMLCASAIQVIGPCGFKWGGG